MFIVAYVEREAVLPVLENSLINEMKVLNIYSFKMEDRSDKQAAAFVLREYWDNYSSLHSFFCNEKKMETGKACEFGRKVSVFLGDLEF